LGVMNDLDLNLLRALDALLTEGSVTGAANKLGLSGSAMSRTLTRLREATGDPLLVRAGRGLVPTPRAEAIRELVHDLMRNVRTVLAPEGGDINLAQFERTFTIRASEGFVEMFCASLVAVISSAAPRVRLRFAPKPAKDVEPLREGLIDLEIGVVGASAPEMRARLLFRDRFVGAVRTGHPILSGTMTAERYAACRHVVASRRGVFTGPVDTALADLGFNRDVMVVVPSFSDAMRIARQSDLIALIPESGFLSRAAGVDEISTFSLPVPTPEIVISAIWHPRMDADPAHRWLRNTVTETCKKALVGS
jgi:DNA-binding transcriptional LysR family regulator